jgi:hypothetical protein
MKAMSGEVIRDGQGADHIISQLGKTIWGRQPCQASTLVMVILQYFLGFGLRYPRNFIERHNDACHVP